MKTRKRGLFDDSKDAAKHPMIHYGTAKGACNSIKRIRGKPRARQLATRMYYRAKYHKYQTKGMRNAMKVWGRYLKTFKQRGGNYMAKYTPPSNVHDDGTKAMVIVEPREHARLKDIIANFDKNMPKEWDLYLFYGNGHGEHAKEVTKSIGRKVYLKELDTNNLDADEYNELFKKKEFWDKVDAETILVFQTDGAICSNSTFKIDQFLKYDYIGCSYGKDIVGIKKGVWGPHNMYGVGGVSLRKKSFMQKCIADNPTVPAKFPEDVFYSDCVAYSQNKPESGDILSQFCSQIKYEYDSLFVHKLDSMQKNRTEFLQYCPESALTRRTYR